jgi:hypothetical protein
MGTLSPEVTLPAWSGVPWRSGIRAGVGASILNAILFGGAVLAGIFPHLLKVDPAQPGLTVPAVILVSMLAGIGGVTLHAWLASRSSDAWRIFLAIAGAVLLLSFAAPYLVPGTTAAQAWIQNLMHVVAAVAVLLELRAGSPRP